MSDELRAAISSAIEGTPELEVTAPTPVPETPTSSEPQALPSTTEASTPVEPIPAKPEGEIPDAKVVPEGAVKPEATPKPESTPKALEAEPEDKPAHRVDRAPQSWRKELKDSWSALPVEVRQEIHRRENEINKALSETGPIKQFGQTFQQTVAPYMARIQSAGISPIQAVKELLAADHVLSSAPPLQRAQRMARLIKEYGVDIKALDDALVGTGSVQGPTDRVAEQVKADLMRELAPVLTFAQQAKAQQAQTAQQVQQQATQLVEQMANDPKYPYFEDVRADMADLMELYGRKNVPLDVETCYNKAVQLNDDVQRRIQHEANQQGAVSAHQAAQRAKAAASSVTGAPATGGASGVTTDGTIRGALEAAFSGQRF